MNKFKSLLCASAIVALATAIPAAAQAAATGSIVAPGPAPSNVQGFVGMWSVKTSWKKGPIPAKGELPLTPELEAKRAKLEAMDKANVVLPGRNAKCLPGGIFDQFTFGFRVEANSEYMLVIGGEGPTLRPVWLKRAKHTVDNLLFPTYQGESIAHLDGDTLVIDTAGINEDDEITYALSAEDPKMRLVEKWHLNNANELQVDGYAYSKKAFTAPWHFTMVYQRTALNNDFSYCDDPSKAGELNINNPPADRYVPPGADQ